METLKLIFILIVGFISGFLNVNAGGGSLITMPILIFLGLPSAIANGTNRVAIMAQNLTAISNFKKNGYFNLELSLILSLPALLGSLVGSSLAISISDKTFNAVLACVMVFVLVLIIWEPQKRLNIEKKELTAKDKIIGIIVFFFIGVYGGFIQAGVGFLIIASLTVITGYSLVKINSMKVFIVAVYMSISLIVFVINGKVDWLIGISLALGNSLGGYVGSSFSIKKGDKWIKRIMILAVIFMAAKLLGLLNI